MVPDGRLAHELLEGREPGGRVLEAKSCSDVWSIC